MVEKENKENVNRKHFLKHIITYVLISCVLYVVYVNFLINLKFWAIVCFYSERLNKTTATVINKYANKNNNKNNNNNSNNIKKNIYI